MAIILRGKLKGKNYKLHQWCNDWFMIETGKIVSPLALQLVPEEIQMVHNHKNNGKMFDWFILKDDGTFKRIKRRTNWITQALKNV